MKYKILILGAGKIAKAIAKDFIQQEDIREVGIASPYPTERRDIMDFLKSEKIRSMKLDVTSTHQAVRIMKRYDCAVSAVPYNYNYELSLAAIKAGCNFIDLGGNEAIVKKQSSLSPKARAADIAIIPDTGLAPGLPSILVELALQEIENPESVKLRVGGLPQNPQPPLNYMIVFSVNGLINEYVEPATIIKDSKIQTVSSMKGIEKLQFPGFGELEAFYTSGGTSTLPETLEGKIKNLDYKTIRYPGHCKIIKDWIKKYKRSELMDKIEEECSYKDQDLVLLRVEVESKTKRITYTLIDYQKDGLTAMMRCTGFPTAVIAEMIVRNQITAKGTLKQELHIPNNILIKELKKRGLNIKKKIIPLC